MYLERDRVKSYKRHTPTSTTEITSWSLPHFSPLNGYSSIIWHQIFQKLDFWQYDLRVIAHIWEMKRIDDFSQERTCYFWNWGNWVRVNLSLRVFVRRRNDERFLTDSSRAMTQRSPAQLWWREVYLHTNPGRRRARHFVCRCRYRTAVFDDFRRHVSVSSLASHTLPRDRRHWRRRHFVRRFSFDGWHILYCRALKKDAVCSEGNRKDLVHIFNVFLSQLFLWVRS